jgi:putative methyltransferase (TIGR04325 family)
MVHPRTYRKVDPPFPMPRESAILGSMAMPRVARQIAKWAIPSGVVGWIRERRRPSQRLWQGVYPRFSDVPQEGLAYESDEWILPRTASTASLKEEFEGDASGWSRVESRYLLLPACVAAIARPNTTIRVLDFGGAMGIAYAYFRALLSVPFEYHVVDNRRCCMEGRTIFRDDGRVHFAEDLSLVSAADVVFLSGVLQYVEDYRGTIELLVGRFRPTMFLLTLLPVGTFPTFASAQTNLPGTRMAHWFFNMSELRSILSTLGYRVSFRSIAEPSFDMSNFPPSHRLTHMSNLLFVKGGD